MLQPTDQKGEREPQSERDEHSGEEEKDAEEEEEDVYEVEDIIDDQFNREERKHYYLVKWLGYPQEDNTWEPEENLVDCEEKFQEYIKIRNDRQERRTGRSRLLERDLPPLPQPRARGSTSYSQQARMEKQSASKKAKEKARYTTYTERPKVSSSLGDTYSQSLSESSSSTRSTVSSAPRKRALEPEAKAAASMAWTAMAPDQFKESNPYTARLASAAVGSLPKPSFASPGSRKGFDGEGEGWVETSSSSGKDDPSSLSSRKYTPRKLPPGSDNDDEEEEEVVEEGSAGGKTYFLVGEEPKGVPLPALVPDPEAEEETDVPMEVIERGEKTPEPTDPLAFLKNPRPGVPPEGRRDKGKKKRGSHTRHSKDRQSVERDGTVERSSDSQRTPQVRKSSMTDSSGPRPRANLDPSPAINSLIGLPNYHIRADDLPDFSKGATRPSWNQSDKEKKQSETTSSGQVTRTAGSGKSKDSVLVKEGNKAGMAEEGEIRDDGIDEGAFLDPMDETGEGMVSLTGSYSSYSSPSTPTIHPKDELPGSRRWEKLPMEVEEEGEVVMPRTKELIRSASHPTPSIHPSVGSSSGYQVLQIPKTRGSSERVEEKRSMVTHRDDISILSSVTTSAPSSRSSRTTSSHAIITHSASSSYQPKAGTTTSASAKSPVEAETRTMFISSKPSTQPAQLVHAHICFVPREQERHTIQIKPRERHAALVWRTFQEQYEEALMYHHPKGG